jgi:hypothetical protein
MLARVIHRPLVTPQVLRRTLAMAAQCLKRTSRPIRMLPVATVMTLLAMRPKILQMLPRVKAMRCNERHHI